MLTTREATSFIIFLIVWTILQKMPSQNSDAGEALRVKVVKALSLDH
jgi:hypothetical protein